MGDRAHRREGREEADIAEEEPLLARFGEVLAVEAGEDLRGEQ
jgi:hypothetical protein